MKRRSCQFIFLAMFWPALACLAQELPRHDETPAPLPSQSPSAPATPTPIPQPSFELIPPPAGTPALPPPSMPDLSQLNQIFNQTLPGKEAADYRAHVEWRELKNRTLNDPAVVSAKAAAEASTTDLEKRNRLRIYYEIFYARMRTLASSPGMVAYLDAVKKAHLDAFAQPRVRPTPESSPTVHKDKSDPPNE